jgi:hypothetical protein
MMMLSIQIYIREDYLNYPKDIFQVIVCKLLYSEDVPTIKGGITLVAKWQVRVMVTDRGKVSSH